MSTPSSVPQPPKRPQRLGLIGAAVLVTTVGLAVTGIIGRDRTEAHLAQWTEAQATPTVTVVLPVKGTGVQELVLPGDVDAFYQAPIYARVNGYVKMWYKDIGAKVKAGQVLADIDTPDLDQQLAQAKADLTTVQANANLASLAARRWQALQGTESVSQESIDEKTGAAAAKQASVTSAKANVQRLMALESFKHLTAPFDGVVTARKTDVGALINAGNGGSALELFSVADIHKMRVYVKFPQALAAGLQPGMKAFLKVSQYPNKIFEATLVTSANSVSRESRTVLVQLEADNADGLLWPGMFTEVHFKLPAAPHILHLPTSAVLFRQHGAEVAVVGHDDKVMLKPVEIGRDLGTSVEISSGLEPTDRVVDSPSDSIATGDLVKIAVPQALGRAS